MKSRLAACTYTADPTLPDPRDPDRPLCRCGVAATHPRHTPAELPEVPEQAEHRRRYDGGDA
ncbi:hypothetical protein [Micromonospora sp. NPDC004704]